MWGGAACGDWSSAGPPLVLISSWIVCVDFADLIVVKR